MKSALLDKVKNAVKQIEPSAEIILYGSRARQDFHEGSDWDFLVLLDGIVNADRTDRVRHALYDVELETNEIVSSIVSVRPETQMMLSFDRLRMSGNVESSPNVRSY